MASSNRTASKKKPKPDNLSAQEKIDLQSLAQKIYTLLKHDLKIEQERLGKRRPF